jgi:HPt (histidine-containing phosphotransfer) domain-containing protein
MYNYINLDYIDLMTDGDNDMKATMLEMLLEEMPAEIEKMKAHSEAQEWEDLFKAAHKMKSTLSFIGNDNMTQANISMEHNAKHEENLDQIPQYLEVLENTYLNAVLEIQAAIQAANN